MHIALVTETYAPDVNGVALTVQSLLTELRAAGHRVTLVRTRHPGEAATAPDELRIASLPIPRYPGLRFGLPAGGHLRRAFAAAAVDAVYVATEGPLGYSAVGAARMLGVPVATGFHTRFDDYVRHYGARWLAPVALAWMRHFHARASCTLVPTQELQRWLQTRSFARVELLRRAVDTQLFHPRRRDPVLRAELGLGAADPLVLAVGRIAAEKNLELLVEAFARVRAQAPGARLVWVGAGPARAALEARRLPGQQFVGVQQGEALARWYASADLFLYPSLSETFGNVTLEAMASGVPVLAFDYAAAHEHIVDGHNGWLAPFGDHPAFLRQAERATGEWVAGARPGIAGRAAVEALSPAQVAADLCALLRREQQHLRQIEEQRRRHDAAVHSTIL